MVEKPDCYILPQQRRGDGETDTVTIATGENQGEERRLSEDRRGLHSNIFLSSNDTMTKIVVWLHENCSGEWYIGTAEEETDDDEVLCRVRFDEESDLIKFQEWVGKEAATTADA